MLSRHGIRYPGKKDIVNSNAVISEMKHRGISSSVVKRLQSVMESFPFEEASLLAKTGAKEQWDIGHRSGLRYGSLFHKSSHPVFVSSSSQRTVASLKSFEQGFNEGLSSYASSTYQQRDDLLRFFDNCPRYDADVKNNKSAFAEFRKFREKMFPDIVRRIAGRLSVKSLNISDGKFIESWMC